MERRKGRLPWVHLAFLAFGVMALVGFAPQAMAQEEGEAAPAAAAEEAPAEAPAEPPPPPPPAAPDADEAADEAKKDVEEIVVTGTMIRRKDLNTPAPVAVIGKLELDAAGMVSIGDILQTLPAQSNAIDISVNNGGDGSTRINMRGIGSHRTLVLLNGRRIVQGGTGANSSVDLNTIPTAIVERVEVLKDGASSIYGSDAIGGVVNIITRKEFSGVEGSAYWGTSQHADAMVFDMGVTAGHTSEKGSVMFSAGILDIQEAWVGDRKWSEYDLYVSGPSETEGFHPRFACDGEGEYRAEGVCIYRGGSYGTPQGTIFDLTGAPGNQNWTDLWDMYPDNAFAYAVWYKDPDPNVGVQGWRPMRETGTAYEGTGDLYNYQPQNYLLTPSKRYNIFTQGNYQFHDYVRGFFEASLLNRQSTQKLAATPLYNSSEGVVVSGDNYYNPFGRDFYWMGRRMLEVGNRNFIQDLNTFRAVLGLDGSLPDDLGPFSSWNWEIFYHFGRNSGTEINEGRFLRNRIGQALGPSFQDADGNVVCGTPGNVIDSCVPLNLFGGMGPDGQGTMTPEMINYISYQGPQKGYNTMEGASLRMGGELFQIPFGGPVGLAVGYDYREEFGGQLPDPLTAKGETTGNKSEPTEGGYFVNEGFLELSASLIENMPFAEVVEFSGSIRAFDYSNFEAEDMRDWLTWKAGLRWQILQDVAVRGTISTGFRAPTIAQLFSGNYDSFPTATDPCSGTRTGNVDINCRTDEVPDGFYDPQSQLRAREGGNEDLQPETADIITAGLVFQPTFLEGLTVTLDYWNLDISDSIQSMGVDVILNRCYNVNPSDRDDAWCQDTVQRNASHNITNIINTQTNIGGVEAWGLDFQVRYDMKMDFGRFLWNLEGTYVGKYEEIQADGEHISGKGVYDLNLVMPDWKFNIGLIYGWEEIGAGVNVRITGAFDECEGNDCKHPVHDAGADEVNFNEDDNLRWAFEQEVETYATVDLFVSYTLEWPMGTTRFTVGCNNLLDAEPPRIFAGLNNTTDPAEYDVVGRYFYVRLGQSF